MTEELTKTLMTAENVATVLAVFCVLFLTGIVILWFETRRLNKIIFKNQIDTIEKYHCAVGKMESNLHDLVAKL